MASLEAFAADGLGDGFGDGLGDGLASRIAYIERGPGYASKVAFTWPHRQLVFHRSAGVAEYDQLDSDPLVERDLGGTLHTDLREVDGWLSEVSRQMGCRPR